MFSGPHSHYSVRESTIFKYKHSDPVTDINVYQLDDSQLSEDECHMFFPAPACEELLVARSLEFMTFHPNNKNMNDKFNFTFIKRDSINLFWCSFPKEFKDVCERIARIFGMTMEIIPRVMVAPKRGTTKGTALEFPCKENILSFSGRRCNNPDKILRECDDIAWVGNGLERLGID